MCVVCSSTIPLSASMRLVIFAAWTAALAFGLYADQYGRFDRIEKYIGPVERLLSYSSDEATAVRIAVTAANVIAAWNTRHNTHVWRFVAPTDERVMDVANDKKQVIVATSTTVGFKLRLLNAKNGVLSNEAEWVHPAPVEALRLAITEDGEFVGVLANNVLSVVQIQNGRLAMRNEDTLAGDASGHGVYDVLGHGNSLYALTAVRARRVPPAPLTSLTLRQFSPKLGTKAIVSKINNATIEFLEESVNLFPLGGTVAVVAYSTTGALYASLAAAVANGQEPSSIKRLETLEKRVMQPIDVVVPEKVGPGAGDYSAAYVWLKGRKVLLLTVQSDKITILMRDAISHDQVLAVQPWVATDPTALIVGAGTWRHLGGGSLADAPAMEGVLDTLIHKTHTKQIEQHGGVRNLFVVPAGKDGLSMRGILVLGDGYTYGFQSTLHWESSEGNACTEELLSSIEVPSATSQRAVSSTEMLSFSARLKDQVKQLTALVANFVTDPVNFVSNALHLNKAHKEGTIVPLPGDVGSRKILVRRTDFAHRCRFQTSAGHSTVRGAVSASDFLTGEQLWTLTYHDKVMDQPADSVSLLTSRPKILGHRSSEVAILEHSATHLAVRFLDGASGDITREELVEQSGKLLKVVKLPVVQDGSEREVHAAIFKESDDYSVVVFPYDATIAAALRNYGDSLTVVAQTYESKTDADILLGLRLHVPQHANGELVAPITRLRASVAWKSVFGERSSQPGAYRILSSGSTGLRSVHLAKSLVDSSDRTSNGADRTLSGVDRTLSGADGSSSSLDGAIGGSGASNQLDDAAVAAMEMETQTLPVQVLGDDGVLIKYLNPNTLYVVHGSPRHDAPAVVAASFAKRSGEDELPQHVTISIIDGTSGRILHSKRHNSASGPVASTMHENWIVYTYWNSKLARPEVSVLTLVENKIKSTELAPWNNKIVSTLLSGQVPSMQYKLQEVIHRSYVLPLSVTQVTVTKTRQGMTTPSFLFATREGGVMLIDKRLLDPRRPLNEPSDAEKMEGLMQYSQTLPMRHNWLITSNHTLPALHLLQSAPSAFESTTLISAIGIDNYFVRIAPAKAFDQLDESFNALFFLGVVAMVGVVVLVLDRMRQSNEVKKAWK